MSKNGFLGILTDLKEKAESWLIELEYISNKLYNLTITIDELTLSCNLIEKITEALVDYESMLLQLEFAQIITKKELNNLRIVKDFNRIQEDFYLALEYYQQSKFNK